MENSVKVSIAIPAYAKDHVGVQYLKQSFDSILTQTFVDYEVVVSDHSISNDLINLCEEYSSHIKIVYIKNFYGRGVPTKNANVVMDHCCGEYIKILHHDDFFVDTDALKKIVDTLDSTKKKWLINGFNHTYDGKTFFNNKKPEYPDHLLVGNNLIGAPTNVTIRNDLKVYFDVNIMMGIDHEWYHQLRMKYGMPIILNDILTTSRIRDDRVSAQLASQYDIIIEGDGSAWQFIQSELEYLQEKHKDFFENWKYPND
ncbi:MAG: glycosyltransferase [Nitrosarchaeum sp.]|nr:glycosyltransferase [Nitrosarchaeum sp.]